jgi:hypothetical protein
MKQKVKIIKHRKIDGRYNYGTIVGIEMIQDACYLGYRNEKEYVARFTVPRYKVAYVDCFTTRAQTEWFDKKELEKRCAS